MTFAKPPLGDDNFDNFARGRKGWARMKLVTIDQSDASDDQMKRVAVANNIEIGWNILIQGLQTRKPSHWEFDNNARRVRRHSHNEVHVQLALVPDVSG